VNEAQQPRVGKPYPRLMRFSASIAAALALPLALSMAACSTVREATNFQPPTMQLLSARVEQQTQQAQQSGDLALVRFEVLAENPNAQPVPMQVVEYSVEAGGTTVFSGTRDAQRTIPPFGSMRFDLPAGVPVSVLGSPLTLRSSVGFRRPGALADTLYNLELIRPAQPVSGTASVQ